MNASDAYARQSRTYYNAGARPVAGSEAARTTANVPGVAVHEVQYLHPDHMGSIGSDAHAHQSITSQTGAWVQDVYYYPYGGIRWSRDGGTTPSPASATRRTYTGQYDIGFWAGAIQHYNARQYDYVLGRFLQPDGIVPNPGDPQTLNRFSYGLSNPLKYTDPSGHWPDWDDVGYFAAGVAYQISASTVDGMALNTNYMARQQMDALMVSRAEAVGRGDAFAAERVVGGLGAMAVGIAEAGLGVDMMIGGGLGGAATCIETVGAGCVAGVAVMGAGAGLATAGAATTMNATGAVGQNLALIAGGNSGGSRPFPRVIDPRTGKPLSAPPRGLQVVPFDQRVTWTGEERAAFIKEWIDRGYAVPEGGWGLYDIHHIIPREYGGTNDFDNLVPVLRTIHQEQVNPRWAGYQP